MDELDLLHKKIREQMNDLVDSLARGEMENIEQYRHLTGRIHGFAETEAFLFEIKGLRNNESGEPTDE